MIKKRNTILIIIVLFSIFLLNFYLVSGADTETAYPTKDAHVYSRYPNNNYGDGSEMYCGNWNDGSYTYKNEIFLYFDINSITPGWEKVELYLTITSIPSNLDFQLYESDGSWSESSITWNNRPSHDSHLRTITITKDDLWKIDVTSHVSSSEFSICIYAEYNQWGTVLIRSKEYSVITNRPKLVFTYSETPPDDDPPLDDDGQRDTWEINKTGLVEFVQDGDTIKTTSDEWIRLADINAPESWEPDYSESTEYLKSLVHNKTIYIDVDDIFITDRYDRTVAVIYIDHNETHLTNVNKALLLEGYAVLSDNESNEFDPNDWTLYVAYQSNPDPEPLPDPEPPPIFPTHPDMKDRGSSYSGYSPYEVIPGSSDFNIYCDIENIGNATTGSFRVYFYVSLDSTISTNDYFIRSDWVSSIEVDGYDTSSCSFIFPSNIPDGIYYIGWILDPLDSIDELDEENNDAYIISQQLLVDGTPPSSSISFTPESGSNKIDKTTTFTLSASDNLGSGVSSMFYKIDNGEWIEYIDGFTLKNYDIGKHSISYYSIDNLNNAEEVRDITINKIDLSNAELSVTINIVVVLIGTTLGVVVNLTFYRRAAIPIRLKPKIKKKYVFFASIYSKINELKENLKKVVINYKARREKIISKDIIDIKDEIVNSIVSDLLNRYPDIIIAIYGIGSYFDDSLPPNWVKNDLDIIVIVKSLDEIPKQDWTDIRYEKKEVSGNHVWLGFNTIEALQDKDKFSNESFSNYGWNLLDMKHPEHSKLLYGENIQDKIPETTNMLFDYDDILARGLYHLEKSLKKQDPPTAMKECSKGIFTLVFYFCIYFDPSFRSTTIMEIGRKLKQLSIEKNFIKNLVDFFEDAIIYRITGQYKTEIKELRADVITYIFSLLNQGALHKKMNYKELVKYLTDSFSGFPYLIQVVKKLYLLKH